MSTQIEAVDFRLRALTLSPAANPGKNSVVISALTHVLSAARNHWLLLILGVSASCAAAYQGSKVLGKQTWESSCTILYTSLPIAEADRGLFTPPDLKTITSLVNSPGTLNTLRDEFQLDIPVKVIDKNLTVVVPNGTKMINLTFKWENGVACSAMLNRITELFLAQVDQLRQNKLGGHVRDFENLLQTVQRRYDESAGKLREIYRRENLSDYKNDSIAASVDISQFEFLLAQHRRTESDTIAKMERMEAHLNEVKSQEIQDVEKDKQFEATTESVADNRRRQDRIRELIAEERRIKDVEIIIERKSKELARTRRLAARGIVSPADLEAAESEITGLKAQLEENEKIRKLQEELERIDKVVVPSGKQRKSGSPIIQQILFRKLEMELDLAGTRQEIRQIEAHIKSRRAGLARLEGLRGEIDLLIKKMEAAETERLQLERQIGSLRNLQSLKVGELSVVAPSLPSPYPTGSNKKIVIISIGGIGILASLGLVALIDTFSLSKTSRSKARRLGLPTLVELTRTTPLRHQQLRGLALRLRQFLPEPGSLVLFSSLNESDHVEVILKELAACLVLRDERVLILDTRIGERAQFGTGTTLGSESLLDSKAVLTLSADSPVPCQTKGLADYLGYGCNDLDEICIPSDGFAVDCILAGETVVDLDNLATHRMSQLIAELRRRYTMLLVIAPPLDRVVDLQILSTHAQGIIAVIDSPTTVHQDALSSLGELRGLGAPLLGQIICHASGLGRQRAIS